MNVAGALKLSKDLGPKSKVVTVACDSGLKYISEGLFDFLKKLNIQPSFFQNCAS